jgi:hypothetical protein
MCDSHDMASRWNRLFVAMDRWPYANPWKWSLGVGVLMFFVGWLGMGRLGTGYMAGVIWGSVFFVITAAKICPGPREMLAKRRRG